MRQVTIQYGSGVTDEDFATIADFLSDTYDMELHGGTLNDVRTIEDYEYVAIISKQIYAVLTHHVDLEVRILDVSKDADIALIFDKQQLKDIKGAL